MGDKEVFLHLLKITYISRSHTWDNGGAGGHLPGIWAPVHLSVGKIGFFGHRCEAPAKKWAPVTFTQKIWAPVKIDNFGKNIVYYDCFYVFYGRFTLPIAYLY